MAYTKNLDFILKAMQDRKLKHFRVTGSDKKVLYVQDDPEAILERNVALLKDVVEQHDGLLDIKIYEKSGRDPGKAGSARNFLEYTFKSGIGQPSTAIQGIAGPQIDYSTQLAEMEARLKNEFSLQRKIDDLERRLKDKDQESTVDKYMPAIMGFLMPNQQPVALAGTNDAPAETIDTLKARLNAANNRLLKSDADWINNIEKLADLAESKPEMYKMAVAQLNNI